MTYPYKQETSVPWGEEASQSMGGCLTYILLNKLFVSALCYVIAEVSLTN